MESEAAGAGGSPPMATIAPASQDAPPSTIKLQQSWVLWYFDPRNKDWTIGNYKRVADVETPQQLWTVLAAIPKVAWEVGYFFFMRRGFRPIWEVPENENGGSWSKKVPTAEVHEIAIDLIVHCVAGKNGLLTNNTLVGFSTSPKGDFNVIKIWNTDKKFHANNLLNPNMSKFPITKEVVYTAHNARKEAPKKR